MPILHKFYQTNWANGFETHNAILDITPYKPEVMFIGTFNPDTPHANFADFFYGRNYFWPGLKNLFVHDEVVLTARRMPTNGAPLPHDLLNPTLVEIFSLCLRLRLSFADLISEVVHLDGSPFELLGNDNIVLDGVEYNLIRDGQNNGIGGLAQLDAIEQVSWNTQNIIDYLCQNPQITQIYLTRQPTGIWGAQWNMIVNHPCMLGRLVTNIFTPAAMTLPAPRMVSLLRHWVHYMGPGFGCLDNQWLQVNGVTVGQF